MTIQQHASFDSSAAELNATSKLVKAWESKNAKNAAKAGGVSLMALSLAACGGSSETVDITSDNAAAIVTALTTEAGVTHATVDAAVAAGIASVDITSDNAALIAAAVAAVDTTTDDATAVSLALRNAAADAGVSGTSTMTNAELITAIKTANDASIAAGVDLTTDNATAINAAVVALGISGVSTLAQLNAAYDALANPVSLDFTTSLDTLTGTSGADTFSAVITATSATLTALDSAAGGAGTDTLSIADNSNTAFTLPGSLTLTSVENITLSHTSDAATDVITVDVTNYADVDSITVVNAGTDINTATITTSANVESLTVNGGSGADITLATIADSGTAASATAATTDKLATVSLEGLAAGAHTIQSDVLTSLTLKNVGGVVTNTDGYIAATDVRTLTVSHNGGTNSGSTDAGATTVNVNIDAATTAAGTNTFAVATTLNVDVNAALTAGTIVAAAATDVNVNFDAAVTASTITTAAATTIDYTGTANAVVTQSGAAAAVITNSGTGNLTLNTAIAAGQTYTGGSGVDTVTFAATGTTASTLGAGNDVATFSAVAGAGGSVDAGAGTGDTISATHANALVLDNSTAFNADVANFEVLSLGAIAASTGAANADDTSLNMTNIDGINSVILAGGAAATNAQVNTIANLASGATFEQTALLGANASVALTGAFTGSTDVVNLKATATNGFVNAGALTVASVETINITTNDSDTTAATAMFDLNMDAANATTITVTGDAGITFANGTQAALTSLDASGVTATGAAGVVTFTANAALDTTIKGGSGNDALTGNTGNDTITGNAGTDALVGGAGNDTISGGAGIDTITGGTGVDTMTGGAAADIFVFGTADSGSTTATIDSITDFNTGGADVVRVAAANNVAGASAAGTTNATTDVAVAVGGKVTFAAADDTLAEMIVALAADDTDAAINEMLHFEVGGNTYIFSEGATTADSDDQVIELTGITGMTTLTESTVITGDFTIA